MAHIYYIFELLSAVLHLVGPLGFQLDDTK